jgi:hypothetical protein
MTEWLQDLLLRFMYTNGKKRTHEMMSYPTVSSLCLFERWKLLKTAEWISIKFGTVALH